MLYTLLHRERVNSLTRFEASGDDNDQTTNIVVRELCLSS